jgi:predicted anti-sigma-YlaC factor YlaD
MSNERTPMIRRPGITCKQLVELLSDYYSGGLDRKTSARVRWHLTWCRGCRNYLAQLKATVEAVGRITDDDIDPEYRDRLLEAFRDWR